MDIYQRSFEIIIKVLNPEEFRYICWVFENESANQCLCDSELSKKVLPVFVWRIERFTGVCMVK